MYLPPDESESNELKYFDTCIYFDASIGQNGKVLDVMKGVHFAKVSRQISFGFEKQQQTSFQSR